MSKRLQVCAWTVLATVTAAMGCGDVTDVEQTKVPTIRSVRIEPRYFAMATGATAQLQAVVDADASADKSVRWSTEPSLSGSISPTGLLSSCYPAGLIRIKATSVADTTKTDTLTVFVAELQSAWATLGAIVRQGAPVGSPAPVVLGTNAITGDVDLIFSVDPRGILACRAVESVEVRLNGASIDLVLTREVFSPPADNQRTFRVPLRTTLLPDGEYRLSQTIKVTDVERLVVFSFGTLLLKNH